jgi:hypothetical protein
MNGGFCTMLMAPYGEEQNVALPQMVTSRKEERDKT